MLQLSLFIFFLLNCYEYTRSQTFFDKKYLIANLDQKYKKKEPMTTDEIHSYALLKQVYRGEQTQYAQLFWIANFIMASFVTPLIELHVKPFMQKILIKKEFKEKLNRKKSNINFNSIIGYESVKKILKPVIANLKNQKKFKKLEKIDGLLFHGPPGCGKTYFVNALANEIDIPIISVLIKDLIQEGGFITNKIDLLFEVLVNYSSHYGPVILFLDEIDFLISNREDQTEINPNAKLVLQNLLNKLDGDKELKGILVVACTNYIDKIDPALLRAGRMGDVIEIKKPSIEDIIEFIKVKSKKRSIVFSDEKILELANSLLGSSVTDVIKKLKIVLDDNIIKNVNK